VLGVYVGGLTLATFAWRFVEAGRFSSRCALRVRAAGSAPGRRQRRRARRARAAR